METPNLPQYWFTGGEREGKPPFGHARSYYRKDDADKELSKIKDSLMVAIYLTTTHGCSYCGKKESKDEHRENCWVVHAAKLLNYTLPLL